MKDVNTFAEYIADENRVTLEEIRKIDFEVELIGKMIEATCYCKDGKSEVYAAD